MHKGLTLGSVILLLATAGSAGHAATGAAVLKKNFHPRAAALGDAYIAIADDAYSLYYNPAGLTYMRQSELGTLYSSGLVDDYLWQLSYADAGARTSTWGLGLLSYNGGGFDLTDAYGNTRKLCAQQDWLLSLGEAWRLAESFRMGVTVELLHSTLIETVDATAAALNLGASLNLAADLRLDGAIRHLGFPFQYLNRSAESSRPQALESDDMPLSAHLGMAYTLLRSAPGSFGHDFILAVGGEIDREWQTSGNIGAEYQYGKILALRGGYKFSPDLTGGPSLGAGVRCPVFKDMPLQLDYALEFSRELNHQHLLALSLLLPPNPERPEGAQALHAGRSEPSDALPDQTGEADSGETAGPEQEVYAGTPGEAAVQYPDVVPPPADEAEPPLTAYVRAAGPKPESSPGRAVFLFGNLGYSAYDMENINQMISANNMAFEYYHLPLQSALTGGLGGNGGLGVWTNDHFAFGLELGYLAASSAGGNEWMGEKLDISAFEIGPFIKGGLPLRQEISITGTLGIAYLSLTGATMYDYVRGYAEQNLRLTGSTIEVKASVGLEYVPAAGFGIGMDVGYRGAKITEVKASLENGRSGTLVNPDYSPVSIDYSGMYIQGGVRLYFK